MRVTLGVGLDSAPSPFPLVPMAFALRLGTLGSQSYRESASGCWHSLWRKSAGPCVADGEAFRDSGGLDCAHFTMGAAGWEL